MQAGGRMSQQALQEYDIEPAIELAANFCKMCDPGESRSLEQRNDRSRFAATSPHESVVPDRSSPRDEVGQQGTANSPVVPLVVDIEGKLGRLAIGGAGTEDFKRSPAYD